MLNFVRMRWQLLKRRRAAMMAKTIASQAAVDRAMQWVSADGPWTAVNGQVQAIEDTRIVVAVFFRASNQDLPPPCGLSDYRLVAVSRDLQCEKLEKSADSPYLVRGIK